MFDMVEVMSAECCHNVFWNAVVLCLILLKLFDEIVTRGLKVADSLLDIEIMLSKTMVSEIHRNPSTVHID